MPEVPLSTSAVVFRPFVKNVFRNGSRLLAERRAGQVPLTQPPSFMDELLNDTLSRIRGGDVDDHWWQSLLDRFGQQYVAPDFLLKPALQEWLREKAVAEDLKTIATWRIMATAQDEVAQRGRLAQSYSIHTGEARHFADGPIDAVVAILVAGYIGAIPDDQRALAGLVLTGDSRIEESIDRLSQHISSIIDPTTRRAHTEYAKKELARILAVRAIYAVRSQSDIQKLLRRLDSGDLAAADVEVKNNVRYWTARLCAGDVETLDLAKKLRAQLGNDDPARDLSIVDALICEMGGDPDQAIRFLRDREDPDSRTALFGVLVRSRGSNAALDEFAERIAGADAEFFTPIGWRKWAISMAEVKRWQEAAERLARIEDQRSEELALALFEGVINSQLLLPAERRKATDSPPILTGISPIQGEQAEAVHARAMACFESIQFGPQEIEDTELKRIIADWRRWVRLMDPNEGNARNARNEIRQSLEREDPDVRGTQFAWAFEVSFDSRMLRKYLSRREKLGGLNEEEVFAEYLLFLIDLDSERLSGREFLDYLETRRARLVSVIPDALLETASIYALTKDGQTERARALLEESGSVLDDAETMRLSAMINANQGLDPRRELEQTYEKTGALIDLGNLARYLRQADDQEALLPLLKELVRRHRTVDNVKSLVICLSGKPFFDHRQVIEVLNSYPDLVEQSVDLKAAKAWALFRSGRFNDARELNEQLRSNSHVAPSLVLELNIAVASGDWECLPAIVEREWPKRDEHTAETLVSLAQIAARRGASPDRALMLARLAAERASDDPHILTTAYWLHIQLGRDEEADQDWLSRAAELSSAADGPLWAVDVRKVVTEWMPERRERLAEIEKNWLGGRIPTGIAATMLNLPLTRLLVQIPESNADTADRRKSVSVPLVFGGRPSVELEEGWSLGLDITSILVLHYLDLLESVFKAFSQVKLAPDVMQCLFHEQDSVRFHQPSRVKDGQQVLALCKLERLRVVNDLEVPVDDLVEEVGRDLAALLQAARQHHGKVVCVLPIHRPSSLMEKVADTTAWDDLIISVPDFCGLLLRHGRIDAETHARAQGFLRGQGQPEHGQAEASVLDETIYLDSLALSYLQAAKVLDQIAGAGMDLGIHPEVLDHMDELVRAGEAGEDLAAKIDRIRQVLRDSVESGSAVYLPYNVDQEKPVSNRDDQFTATQSLLEGASDCDALSIDDRFFNSKENFTVTGETERALPIACVLDILGFLSARGDLSPERLWILRHKLRVGGFAFIPFEADELVHWLKASPVENGQLLESAELRAIRQSLVRIAAWSGTNPEEIFASFAELTHISLSTIGFVWNDEALALESAAVLSDWIWCHLVVDLPEGHGSVEKERRKAWKRDSTLWRLSALLLSFVESPDRRSSYASWVDASVLQPLRHANSNLIEEALISICDMLADQNNEAEILGNSFLAHLPEAPRRYLLARYPDRARQWGFETRRIFRLESDVEIVDRDLFTAARRVFSGAGEKSVRSATGKEIVVDLDSEDGNIALTYSVTGPDNRKKMPDLALFSPDPQARVATLSTMLERFGPTAPDMSELLSELVSRVPDELELSAIFDEATAGVAAVQGALSNKIDHRHSIDALDILPQNISYFQSFAGPQPQSGTQDPEQYIHDVLIPYRKALLDRELKRGLDICCLGALRDDLCPGQWTLHLDNDAVWEALSSCGAEKSPISLLGALDVALYRADDSRFQEYATQAVDRLCDDRFGQQQGIDFYRLLWIFMRFAFNRINLIENGSKQPGFWKRMCAWMQAQFVARTLSGASASIAGDSLESWMDGLEEWSMSSMALVGAYAELVDARGAPMLLFTERLSSSDLHCEVLGRLVALRARHAIEKRHIPHSKEIDQALERTQERGNWPKCFFPGPLEGHRRPSSPVSEGLAEILNKARPEISLPGSWHSIANISHLYSLGDTELDVARSALVRLSNFGDDGEMEDILLSLEVASIVAKTSRDTLLADAIVEAIVGVGARVSNENEIWLILVICLQAAAAFHEHDDWFEWLEERLARIANCLPGPPSRVVRIFLEHLDAMETILPIDSWFHRRARSIASAGAELRP